MLFTTAQLKTLAKTTKKQFKLSYVASFLNKFIKNEKFQETISAVIGRKGNETLDNSQANELTATMLGYKDYNTATAKALKAESLSTHEISDKLQTISENLNGTLSQEYLDIFNVVKKQLKIAIEENHQRFSEDRINVLEMIDEGNTDSEKELDLLDFLHELFDPNIKSVIVDSDLEDDILDISLIININENDKLDIDAKVYMDEFGAPSYVEGTSTINDIKINSGNDLYDNFLLTLTGGLIDLNIKPTIKNVYTKEQIKQISVLVSSL
jgi:hypothetical protein